MPLLRQQRGRTAFTLVELLVATSITALIVVMLGTMFASLTSTSLRANQRIDAFRDARAALQMMERDLSGIVRTQWEVKSAPIPTPPPIPLNRPAAYLALTNRYTDPGAVSPTTDNQQIYALIATKNTGRGDVCSVGYYCQWETAQNAYCLHRFFNPSDNSKGTGTYSRFSEPTVVTKNYASDSDLYDLSLQGTSDELLASYVWNLRITPYDASGAILANPYPYICDSSATSNNPPPVVIEVSFKTMSPNAARALISTGAQADVWMDSTNAIHKRLITPHTYEFRTRIKL